MKSIDQKSTESGIRMIRLVTIIGTIAALLIVFATTDAVSQSSPDVDLKFHTEQTPSSFEPADGKAYQWHRPITSGSITLYQKLISPARGTSCPMHPHCSKYCREAFANHNPIRAWVMTTDRLLRCGHDLNQYRPTGVDGRRRYSDPIVANQAFDSWTIFAGVTEEYKLTYGTDFDTQVYVESTMFTTTSPDSLLYRFAHQQKQNGEYERAVTEYLRLLSYYPNSQYIVQAKLAAVECYYVAGLYSQAIAYGESVLSERMDSTIAYQVRFLVGASRFKSGEFEPALPYFANIAEGGGSLSEKGIMAQGLTHAHLYDWVAAARSFDAIDDASELSIKAHYCARLSREAEDLGYKNPKIAGLLAIIPGFGYAYDGYYSTALSALIVNGLFMWSTYEAFQQDHNGLGVTLAIFGMGWYTGNIYGSAYSAVRQNEKRQHDHLLKFDLGFKF